MSCRVLAVKVRAGLYGTMYDRFVTERQVTPHYYNK